MKNEEHAEFFFPQSRLLKVDSQDLNRIQAFSKTPFFRVQSGSYSSYWKHHADLIEVASSGANPFGAVTVKVSGESGFYITPSSKSTVSRLKSSLARSVRSGRIGRQVTAWSTYPRPVMMSIDNAYDFLMSSLGGHPHLPEAIPFPVTSKDVRTEFKWSDREATDHVLIAYYLLSIIMRQTPLPARPLHILEIGPGSEIRRVYS